MHECVTAGRLFADIPEDGSCDTVAQEGLLGAAGSKELQAGVQLVFRFEVGRESCSQAANGLFGDQRTFAVVAVCLHLQASPCSTAVRRRC